MIPPTGRAIASLVSILLARPWKSEEFDDHFVATELFFFSFLLDLSLLTSLSSSVEPCDWGIKLYPAIRFP